MLWVGTWVGVALGALATFPVAGGLVTALACFPLALACLGLLCAGLPPSRQRLRLALPLLLAGCVLGAQQPWARRGADPATRPLDPAALSSLPAADLAPLGSTQVVANGIVRVPLPRGGVLEVDPILRFRSRSPDRAWTIFAGRWGHSELPFPLQRVEGAPGVVQLRFGGPLPGVLRVSNRNGLELDARRTLPEPIYSHLNHACSFGLVGPRGTWWIRFGEGGERIQIVGYDYPVGRPARCAVLRRGGKLEVLEATSAEKGPFRTLASTSLGEGPLVITLERDELPVVRLTLFDWASQVSQQRSPTAGWGLPENGIEFWAVPGGKGIWISASWAATSVGRGWDSVGHAAGTYRNRIRIEPLGG